MPLIVINAFANQRFNRSTGSAQDVITFVDVAYGVSFISLLASLIIYRLNMKQLSSVSNKIEHPLKKPRALMIIQCALYLLLSMVFQLTWLHVTELRPLQTRLTYWLQLLHTLFILCFYFWCHALYILNFYLTKYLKNASREMNLIYVYLFSYSIPLIVVAIILVLSQTNQSIASVQAPSWRWIILGVQVCVLILMTAINIYAICYQLKSVKRFTNTLEAKLRRLYKADKIRNGLIMELLLLLIWLLEVVVATGKMVDFELVVYLVVLINAFLGPYFLLLETWFYDKNLRKPFRWQQRRAEIKTNKEPVSMWNVYKEKNLTTERKVDVVIDLKVQSV